MNERQILQALRALAEGDREREAPPAVEDRVTEAFRARLPPLVMTRKRATTARRVVAACSIAAAAAIAVLMVAKQPRNIVQPPPAEMSRQPVPRPGLDPAPSGTPVVKAAVQPARPGISRHVHSRVGAATPLAQESSREVVTDFFPLMDPAPPFDRGQILRVRLPAAAMQSVGLPVGADHLADQIQADVLVGEEGLPRAIRFVQFEMK